MATCGVTWGFGVEPSDLQDGQLVRRLLDHLGLRLLTPDAVVLEGVMPLLEKLGERNGAQDKGDKIRFQVEKNTDLLLFFSHSLVIV